MKESRKDTKKYVPFSLENEKYDQSTFYGRFRRMLDMVDPSTLLCTNEDLQQSIQLLDQYKKGEILMNGESSEELWKAKKIRDAMIHPDTGEIIPQPCRMSGFLPYNAPICIGALVATSNPSILFWHWLNQTQNALVNYYNRNASEPMPTSTLIQGYIGAVTGAIGVAMGLKELLHRKLPKEKAIRMQKFVALPSIMTAAAINVILMRREELNTGVHIFQEDGTVIGSSKAAAKKALVEMTLSRMALPIPVFAFPPIGASIIESIFPKLMSSPRAKLAVNATLLFIGFGIGLPAAIAIFPQKGSINVIDIEPELSQNLNVNQLYYNKGL